MKDVSHHLKHIQKKVIQSSRRETLKKGSKVNGTRVETVGDFEMNSRGVINQRSR